MQDNQWKIIVDQLLTSYLIEWNDKSTMRWKPSKYRWLSIEVKHRGHTIHLNLQNWSDCDKWNLLTSGIVIPFFSGLNLEGGMPSSLFEAALTICTATDFDLSFVYPSLLCSLPTPKITKLFISVQWRESCLLTARSWWSITMTYSWSYPLRQCRLRQISNYNLINWGNF